MTTGLRAPFPATPILPRSWNRGRVITTTLRFRSTPPSAAPAHTEYVVEAVVPPRPVQLVWEYWPRGLSTRSYVWAPK